MGAPVSVVGPSVDYYATRLMIPSKRFTSSFTFQYILITTAEMDDKNARD